MTLLSGKRRLGIIGTGKMGLEHALAAKALGHEVVVGHTRSVESTSWRRFYEQFPSAIFSPGMEDMLFDSGLDAILVALPWNVMPDRLEKLLSCPKPMLLEKPISLSFSHLCKILQSPETFISNKFVGMNRRFYLPVRRLYDRVQKGGLLSADIVLSEDVARLIKRFGSDIVPNIYAYSVCHALDTAMYVLGRLYAGLVNRLPQTKNGFYGVTALLQTEAGVPVTIQIHESQPVNIGIRCYFGDRTVWHLSPLERLRVYDSYEIQDQTPGRNIRTYSPKLAAEWLVEFGMKPGILEQMRCFLEEEENTTAATPHDVMDLLHFSESLIGLSASLSGHPPSP